ncbi:MAG: ROK family transcriptional regulator [Elainellaceae cyanobacterium]
MQTKSSQQSLMTDASLLKQINHVRILGIVRCHSGISRAEIARRTGLNRSTVTVITGDLIENGLLREGHKHVEQPGSGGRPGIGLELNPDGAFFIGAAIDADRLTVVEMNLAAQVIKRIQVSASGSMTPEAIIHQLVSSIDQLRCANPFRNERLRGIGITVPGTLNREGVIIRAPKLGWQHVDLRSYLESQTDLPIYVENDANAAALVEVYLGKAIPTHSLIYLLLDAGVGGGIVINNRIFRGAHGTAGEICELLIDEHGTSYADGETPGSLGGLVSREALLNRYAFHSGQQIDFEIFLNRLSQNDDDARMVLQDWAESLGRGLISLVKVFDPERIVLGGQLAVLVPYVRNQLEGMLRDCLPASGTFGFFSEPDTYFDASEFREDAPAIGGAVLVYQSLFQVPDLVLL